MIVDEHNEQVNKIILIEHMPTILNQPFINEQFRHPQKMLIQPQVTVPYNPLMSQLS